MIRSNISKLTNPILSSSRINTIFANFFCDKQNYNGCRQNFHPDCEAGLNKQIMEELYAGYSYLAMASYFGRHDVALPGFKQFFEKSAEEENDHAKKLIKYMNMRGGHAVFDTLRKPEEKEWKTGLNALVDALTLEHKVNQSLLQLHKAASQNCDPQLCHFLEHELLDEQIESIYHISEMIGELTRAGPGHGEFHFDQLLLKK